MPEPWRIVACWLTRGQFLKSCTRKSAILSAMEIFRQLRTITINSRLRTLRLQRCWSQQPNCNSLWLARFHGHCVSCNANGVGYGLKRDRILSSEINRAVYPQPVNVRQTLRQIVPLYLLLI